MNDPRRIVQTDLAPTPDTATSQCMVVNGVIYVSAQIGKSPSGFLPADFDMQMKNTMYNIRAILESSGSDLNHVIKVSVQISDRFYYDQMEELYKVFFPTQDPPVREVMVVSSLPHGALVQVSITAIEKNSF
jgi:2-iminobutanoate/2-iminopropanoate deaminase